MFTWLTNSAAFGLVLLMALTSFAIMGYFAKHRTKDSLLTRVIAPLLSGLALVFIFIQIIVNFDVLLGMEEPGMLGYILMAVVIVPGIIGFLVTSAVRTRTVDTDAEPEHLSVH